MNITNAKLYISNYFKYNSEARSWAVDTGVFTLQCTKSFDDETLILVAEDLREQVVSSIHSMVG